MLSLRQGNFLICAYAALGSDQDDWLCDQRVTVDYEAAQNEEDAGVADKEPSFRVWDEVREADDVVHDEDQFDFVEVEHVTFVPRLQRIGQASDDDQYDTSHD